MEKNKKIIAGITTASLLAVGGTYAYSTFVDQATKKILYRHHRDDDTNQRLEIDFGAKTFYIKNNMSIRLRGLLIEEKEATKTLLVLHPFGLDAKSMAMYVPFFKNKLPGCNILMVDSRAHGQSDGYIRGLGVNDVDDLVVWNEYILNTFGKDHQIILYGKEVGAATILLASSRQLLKNVVAIISDGCFTSGYDLISYRIEKDYKMPAFPCTRLIRRKIQRQAKINIKENIPEYVKHNDIPTIYFHSFHDEFVPLEYVYPLYNANRGEKVLFVVKEERYLCDVMETNDFKSTFEQFLSQYVK
ncbi:alpha/beta hydrolase [Tannockella kyphosi]|uniref:alpha/beta hydrolase n=1 Tax=Tannockella kyphosi TaxID=2899121 RepID=UPI002013997A|nr:alpha/beta hydrolase [Tannockella kyphosi]